MKKTTVQYLTIGSVALTAVTAGAWLMFTSQPKKKEMTAPLSSPPSVATEKTYQQQTNVLPEPKASVSQISEPGHSPMNVLDAAPDSTDQQPENTPENTAENNEKNLGAKGLEANEGTAAKEGKKRDETADPDQDVSEQNAATGDPESGKPSESNASATSPLADEQQSELGEKEDAPMDPTAISSFPSDHNAQRVSGPSCTEITPVLSQFFHRLEQKEYIMKKTSKSQSLQEYFNALASQLLNNPPVVAHETDELYA
ncbi:MAG: hypothetical protein D3909_08535, partial [Candidatus Electrothrix sp. ATG1]|nr:hypothetical protein [Candidatus Electrothrix sp. ATG1]